MSTCLLTVETARPSWREAAEKPPVSTTVTKLRKAATGIASKRRESGTLDHRSFALLESCLSIFPDYRPICLAARSRTDVRGVPLMADLVEMPQPLRERGF